MITYKQWLVSNGREDADESYDEYETGIEELFGD